jgi:hypothetical protein
MPLSTIIKTGANVRSTTSANPKLRKSMEKKIRKRYHSEEAVKKALKIESFRNLTKDKVMEFTSMIPYMEKEVALEIIKQFPVYVEFVESAIENYIQLCKTILETNKEEYEQAVHAHQYVLETFANQLELVYDVFRSADSFFHLMSGIIDSILHHPIHNKSIKKIICKG